MSYTSLSCFCLDVMSFLQQPLLLWTYLFYSRSRCLWCLGMSVLQLPVLLWTCLSYSSLSCLQTCLFYSSLCCLWTYFYGCLHSTVVIGQTPPGTVQAAVKRHIQAQHSLLQYRSRHTSRGSTGCLNHTCPLSTIRGQRKLL